jgi:drug/metabolite transporter (DMT)-like permease
MGGAIKAVVSSPMFLLGVLSMALSFFTLLFTLSNVEVSLAAPASASLTFLGNAFAAKLFLKENVDRRRWLAALFVCAGVFLLSK